MNMEALTDAVARAEAAALAMGTTPASMDRWHAFRAELGALVAVVRESEDVADFVIRTLLLDVAAARTVIRSVTA